MLLCIGKFKVKTKIFSGTPLSYWLQLHWHANAILVSYLQIHLSLIMAKAIQLDWLDRSGSIYAFDNFDRSFDLAACETPVALTESDH